MVTLKEEFLRRYPKRGKVLQYYKEANGVTPDWPNLSKANIARFIDYMRANLSQNSARQYASMFKYIISLYDDKVKMPDGYKKVLNVKRIRTMHTWLTEYELKLFEQNAHPIDDFEEMVWASFLVGAYTGARRSDFLTFNDKNICEGMLCYVSQKTHIAASVPLKPIVAGLLPRTSYEKGNVDLQQYNTTLRSLCFRAGIRKPVKIFYAGRSLEGPKHKFITSHTARRSFATNLYLRGADIYAIAKMMGHTSTTTTEGYICCGLRELPDKVLSYFE